MTTSSKRMRTIKKSIDLNKSYSTNEAITQLKTLSKVKFDESLDVSVHCNIPESKSKQITRGFIFLPHGTGKKIRVAVLTNSSEHTEALLKEGATKVGSADLIEEIKNGIIDFDELIATPDAMPLISQVGAILGPKKLMPNPKLGTVTNDPIQTVKEILKGRVQYRFDKGIVNCAIGKLSFEILHLETNLKTLVNALYQQHIETTQKHQDFFRKLTISSTMGPSFVLDKDIFPAS